MIPVPSRFKDIKLLLYFKNAVLIIIEFMLRLHIYPLWCLQSAFTENFAKRLSLLTELATKYPDLRDSYLVKSQTAAYNFDIISDASRVQAQLDDLKPLFESIESQLKKIKEGKICETIHVIISSAADTKILLKSRSSMCQVLVQSDHWLCTWKIAAQILSIC